MSTTQILYKPSDKQVKFLTVLASERNFTLPENLDRAQASKLIDQLLKQPKTTQIAREPGVYTFPDGSVVKVQFNKAKDGVYAKRWVEFGGTRLVDDTSTVVKGHWVYEDHLIDGVKPEFRMDLEQAKAFILRYGQCARCSRKLKAAESVERGIGPVCKDYFTF